MLIEYNVNAKRRQCGGANIVCNSDLDPHDIAAARLARETAHVVCAMDAPSLHGKAGVIESREGSSTALIGSLNETREGGWEMCLGEQRKIYGRRNARFGVIFCDRNPFPAFFQQIWSPLQIQPRRP